MPCSVVDCQNPANYIPQIIVPETGCHPAESWISSIGPIPFCGYHILLISPKVLNDMSGILSHMRNNNPNLDLDFSRAFVSGIQLGSKLHERYLLAVED